MTQQNFSIREAFFYGWEVTKEKIGFFISILLIYFFIVYLPEIVPYFSDNIIFNFFVGVVGWVVWMIALMGLVGIALKLYDKKEVKISDLFAYYPLFFRFLIAQILYFLVVVAGFILFIVPGIIFAVRFWFFDYFIIDKKLGPIEALRQSWRVTQGKIGKLFLFGMAVILVTVLGALALVVGLFVALPITMMATVFVYKKLLPKEEKEEEAPSKKETEEEGEEEMPAEATS